MTNDLTPAEREELDALEAEMSDLFAESAETLSAEAKAQLSAIGAAQKPAHPARTGSRPILALAALVFLMFGGLIFAVEGAVDRDVEAPAETTQSEAASAIQGDNEAMFDDADSMDRAPDDVLWVEGDWPGDEGAFADGLDLLSLPPSSPHAEESLEALEDALDDLGMDA